MDFKTVRRESAIWINLARDRGWWHGIVKGAINIQVILAEQLLDFP
jgi:hypothetical protein